MAEINSKADLIKAGYKGYTGWGENEAIADYRATGGSGKYDPGPSASQSVLPTSQPIAPQVDFEAQLAQAQRLLSEAQAPRIEGLEAQRGITEERFGAQREDLAAKEESMQTRYQNLLADIKGRETRETQSATKLTANELAQRGIAPGSTFSEQQLQGAVQPISQVYGGLTRDIGLAQSEEAQSLANLGQQLTVEEQQAQRDISSAIEAIQSATSTQAIEVAMKQLEQAQQAQQFAQQQATQRYGIDVSAQSQANQLALQQAAQQLAQQQYEQEWPYQQRAYEYNLNKPYYSPNTGTDDGSGGWS